MKAKIDDYLAKFNSSKWKVVQTFIEKGRLAINFPQADEISNGQRDVLTFIVQLIMAEEDIRNDRLNALFIDDANYIIAQYYLSQLLNKWGNKLFVVIFTHLSPEYFRSNIFKPQLVNIQFLSKSNECISANSKAFIVYRKKLDRSIHSQQAQYDVLSKNFFHYNHNPGFDYTGGVPVLPVNFKNSWLKLDDFKRVLVGELNKYLEGTMPYEPYLVALSLRMALEKKACQHMTPDQKVQFINRHKITEKFKYVEDLGISLSESYKILGAIYNEAEHLKSNVQDKRCVYMLKNEVVRHVVRCTLDFNGTAKPNDYLD